MSLDQFNYVSPSVTKTADANHSDIDNAGYNRVLMLAHVSSVDTSDADETYEFKIQGKDPISGNYYDILSTGTFTSTGIQRLEVGAGLTEAGNSKSSNLIPGIFRVKLVTGGTSPSITYTIHIQMT